MVYTWCVNYTIVFVTATQNAVNLLFWYYIETHMYIYIYIVFYRLDFWSKQIFIYLHIRLFINEWAYVQ